MSKATYPLKLPASIKAAAARLAKEDGVSLNQWITAAVAQKIGAVETAADFLKRRAGNASPEDLRAFLANAPDVPPEPGDEISLPSSRHAETLVGARVMARARRPSKRQPELEQFFMRLASHCDRRPSRRLEIPGAQAVTPAAEAGTPPAGGAHTPRALRGGCRSSPPRALAAATPHRERVG